MAWGGAIAVIVAHFVRAVAPFPLGEGDGAQRSSVVGGVSGECGGEHVGGGGGGRVSAWPWTGPPSSHSAGGIVQCQAEAVAGPDSP